MSDTPSDAIGHLLREAREKKGLTFEEAEKATRIRARFLAALEEDDFAALPSATQARGFLNLYAAFLGLQAEQVTDWYDAQRKKPRRAGPIPAPRPKAQPPPPTRPPAKAPERSQAEPAPDYRPQVRPRRLRWLSADVFVAVALTLVLGTFLLWGILQFAGGEGFSPTGTPTRAPTPAAGTASATPPPADAAPTEPLPTPRAVYNGVNLIVRAEQRAWVRVTVDGTETYAGLMVPGASKEFNGQNVVELTTGNGLGTRVIWNGRDQGTLGQIGEVIIRLWTRDSVMTPTPSLTPVPSRTPSPTPTPKP